MRIIDNLADGHDLMGREFRIKHFMKELSAWLASHADSPVDKIYPVMMNRFVAAQARGQGDSFVVSFKVVVPDQVVHEDLDAQQNERGLLEELRRLSFRWVAQAIDFELMFESKVQHPKRSIRDTWQEACTITLTPVIEANDDGLIEDEKRFELFAKAVVVPPLKALLESGYRLQVIDPRMVPSLRYVGAGGVGAVIRGILLHAVARNKTKKQGEFQSSLTVTVIKP